MAFAVLIPWTLQKLTERNPRSMHKEFWHEEQINYSLQIRETPSIYLHRNGDKTVVQEVSVLDQKEIRGHLLERQIYRHFVLTSSIH